MDKNGLQDLRSRLRRHRKRHYKHYRTETKALFSITIPDIKQLTKEALALRFGDLLSYFPQAMPKPFLAIARSAKHPIEANTILLDWLIKQKDFEGAQVILSELKKDYELTPQWLSAQSSLYLANARHLHKNKKNKKRLLQAKALLLIRRALEIDAFYLPAHFARGLYYTDSGSKDDIDQGIRSWALVDTALRYSTSKYAQALLYLSRDVPNYTKASKLLQTIINTERTQLFTQSSIILLGRIKRHLANANTKVDSKNKI